MKETLECCDSLFKLSESDRLPKLNASLFLSFLSFFFYEKLFFNDPFSTWIQHWKPRPRSTTAKRRFKRIVRSNLSFLLCRSAPKYFNRITSDDHMKIQTQLRNEQCLACVHPIRDARGWLGEHEGQRKGCSPNYPSASRIEWRTLDIVHCLYNIARHFSP